MDNIKLNTVERRRHPRTILRMSLRCVRLDPDGGELVDTLHMTNISRGGMGVVCDRSFYRGQRIVLCLPLAQGHGRRSIYASVVRCRPGDNDYHVGLEFEGLTAGARYGSDVVAAATMAATPAVVAAAA